MSTVELTDSGLGQAVDLSMEDRLVLRLSENPTTGFRWQTSQSGAGELRLIDDHFESGGAPLLPGAAGHRVLTFSPSRAGSVTLSLVQQRPSGASAGRSNQITVVVHAQ